MNRLSPLIERRPRAFAAPLARPVLTARFEPFGDPPPTPSEWRLFATSFLGGLVFFGTYLA